jgi:D-arabinose 1-dehydrogenase-like Zn-dependent alcohol dehydrogenase
VKAILFPSRDTVEIASLPDPRPGPGEVVIDVRASGLCHTDIEVLRGNYGTGAYPVVPGHEYAGVVAETGAGVDRVSVGDRVVIDPNLNCGVCMACAKGWAHLCDDLGAYGVTMNGGFAERSVSMRMPFTLSGICPSGSPRSPSRWGAFSMGSTWRMNPTSAMP